MKVPSFISNRLNFANYKKSGTFEWRLGVVHGKTINNFEILNLEPARRDQQNLNKLWILRKMKLKNLSIMIHIHFFNFLKNVFWKAIEVDYRLITTYAGYTRNFGVIFFFNS